MSENILQILRVHVNNSLNNMYASMQEYNSYIEKENLLSDEVKKTQLLMIHNVQNDNTLKVELVKGDIINDLGDVSPTPPVSENPN